MLPNLLSDPKFWLELYSWNSLTMIMGKLGMLQMVLAFPKQQSVLAIVMNLLNNLIYFMVVKTSNSLSGMWLTIPFVILDTFFLIYIFLH